MATVSGLAYDYIVVGAGSAGCALASRLARGDPNSTVLLIEAGDHAGSSLLINVPAIFLHSSGSKWDWNFTTTPQPSTRGRKHYWPRGKVVGGSSGTNAMIYVRGNPEDYNLWEKEHGCNGWGWDSVKHLFNRIERCTINPNEIDADRGRNGPLVVARVVEGNTNELSKLFVRASEGLGIGARPDGGVTYTDIGAQTKTGVGLDYNGDSQHRASLTQVTIKDGVRCSAAAAYINPLIMNPGGDDYTPNLVVATGITVTKIHTYNEPAEVGGRLRANGVSGFATVAGMFGSRIVPIRFSCTRELVIACGAVASPHLLKLSGIGPRQELEDNGIPVVKDLPGVGENLQDHIVAPIYFEDLSGTAYTESVSFKSLYALAQYFGSTKKSGMLTSNMVEAVNFFSTDTSLDKNPEKSGEKDTVDVNGGKRISFTPGRPKPPNMQLHFMPASLPLELVKTLLIQTIVPEPLGKEVGADGRKFNREEQLNKIKVLKGEYPPHAIILTTLLHPYSRGSIRLDAGDKKGSPDAFTGPNATKKLAIDPRYLTDTRDLDAMIEAIQITRKLIEKMHEIDPKSVGKEIREDSTLEEVMRSFELDADTAYESSMYIAEYVRRYCLTLYHPVGTCKMGPVTDPLSVVCPKSLRVHGFANLRVCDASVMPTIVSGNTNAPCIMIGEKCSDMILGEYGLNGGRGVPQSHL